MVRARQPGISFLEQVAGTMLDSHLSRTQPFVKHLTSCGRRKTYQNSRHEQS